MSTFISHEISLYCYLSHFQFPVKEQNPKHRKAVIRKGSTGNHNHVVSYFEIYSLNSLFQPACFASVIFMLSSFSWTMRNSNNTGQFQTAFTRCRHILKTVKNSTDKPPVHTKTAHFCRQILKTVDFENGALNGTFWKRQSCKHLKMAKEEHF